MTAWHRIAFSAFLALSATWVVPAQASVTYVFIATSLQESHGDNRNVPMPLAEPMGRLTITDAAFAERKVDSRLDVLDFYFNVPLPAPVFFGINNQLHCQAPTVTFRCSLSPVPISLTLTENGEIDSGIISYYGGSLYGHDFEYFDNDRILRMRGIDGDWSGEHIAETGACGQHPGCLFTGNWVPIPEPATATLLGTGFGVAFWLRRRRST
jgi:hypothetical protein